jgi:hypothetical protein
MACNRTWDEMPKLCALPVGGQGPPVYVNPTLVRYIRAGSNNTCLIHFADNQSVGVGVSIEDAVRLLNVALNSDQP